MPGKMVFAISILLICSNCFAQEQNNLPTGWRLPSDKEIEQDWRNDSKSKFSVVTGDFDGNGKIDYARQLIDTEGKNYAVFASLNQMDASYIHIALEIDGISALGVMGIDKVEPGKYKTACGKGYFDCDENEPKEIALQNDSINYFKEGSANSFFYWDVSSFKRIWISD